MNNKPFVCYKNLDEQLKILEQRHLFIPDKRIAKELLQSIGYTNLIDKFKFPFIDNGQGKNIFKANTSINNLYNVYFFDSLFRNSFLDMVLHVQTHFGNVIGNAIAEFYGVNSDENSEEFYLNFNNYHSSRSPSIVRDTLKNIKEKLKETKYNPTNYYRKNKANVPPWILVQNLYFGELIRLYMILKEDVKTKVVNEMIPTIPNENIIEKKELFFNSLNILKEFRNFAAHSFPMYSHAHIKNNMSGKVIKKYIGENVITNRYLKLQGIFSALIALNLLSKSEFQRADLIRTLGIMDDAYKNEDDYHIYLNYANIPYDYIKRIKKASDYLTKIKFNLN